MPDWNEFKARFGRIAGVGQRQLKIIDQEKLDEAERAAEAQNERLASWSADHTCQEDFLPLMHMRLEAHKFERGKILSDHPKLTETLGRESELEWLIAKFREWAAKA